MVTKAEGPRISWEEDIGPEEAARLSEEIVALITQRLPEPEPGRARLYFVVPTPAPYDSAEADYLAAVTAAGGRPESFRVVTLPRGGKAYLFGAQELFKALLPQAFRLGPPELTLVAANCWFDLHGADSDVATFLLAYLKHDSRELTGEVAGLHFDSGDLVEVF